MTLKIGWATPWSDKSAIASFSQVVVAELMRRGHRIDILRSEVGETLYTEPLPCPGCGLRWISANDPAQLRREYDVVVGNFGNYFANHGALAEAMTTLRPVAVFHDLVMTDFFAAWSEQAGWAGGALQHLAAGSYGQAAAAPPAPGPTGPFRGGHSARTASEPLMIEVLAHQAPACIVHAEHYVARVAEASTGPTCVIPMAYPDWPVPPPRPVGRTLTIATIGHLNPNKRIREVIHAVASSPRLRDCCRYLLIGPYQDQERQLLEAFAAEQGIQPPTFTGWLDDTALSDALAEVDVISCLRHPLSEGASASLIFGMRSRRPVLVSAHGAYSDVPDGLVLKCSPGDEAADVVMQLEAILDHPHDVPALGEAARSWSLAVNSAERYVDKLVPFLYEVIRGSPAWELGWSIGSELSAWGIEPGDPSVASIGEAAQTMFRR